MLDVPADNRLPLRGFDPAHSPPLPTWSFLTVFSILRWRWRRIVWTAMLVLAAAAVYVSVSTPKYTAVATLSLATKRTPPGPTDRAPETLVDTAVVDSELEALRSERIALAVIDQQQLWNDREFVDTSPAVIERVLSTLGVRSDTSEPSQAIKRQIALGAFKSGLEVEKVGRTYVAEVSFTSRDPKRAAAVAGGIGEAYVADQIASKVDATTRATDWMENRIAELGDKASTAANTVETFKSNENLIVDAQGKLASETELQELSLSLARARAASAEAEAKHSRVERVLQGSGNAMEPYRVALEIARASEDALGKRLNVVFQETAASRKNLVEMQGFEARAQALRSIHDAYLGQYTQAVQQQSFPVTEARILTEPASPLAKSKPRTPIILFLALFTGLALGAAHALGREYFGYPVRDAAQVERDLGLRCIAEIPRVAYGQWRRVPWRQPLLKLVDLKGDTRRHHATTEVVRSIRLSVAEQDGAQVIGVSSLLAGEGKTTLAYNLALLMAHGGSRTLLIEADARKPSLSRGLKPEDQGLAAVLSGDAALADVTRSHKGGFYYIALEPSAWSSFDPTAGLRSARMSALMNEARGAYDFIIVDTPAFGPQADARALARNLDSILLVTEWGRTPVDALHRALSVSSELRNRVAGLVINKVGGTST